MKNIFISFCCCLSVSAFVPVQFLGKQYIVISNRIYSRFWGERFFAPELDLPNIPNSPVFAQTNEVIWDGERLVRSGETADGRYGVETATLKWTSPKQSAWVFAGPHWLPGRSRLLGTNGAQALVEILERAPEEAAAVATTLPKTSPKDGALDPSLALLRESVPGVDSYRRSLWLIEPELGSSVLVQDLSIASSSPIETACLDGKVYLFSGSGKAMLFRFDEKSLKTLDENFWKTLELTLCKKIGDLENHGLAGSVFLDPEGMLLVPIEPLLVLDKDDADRAWSGMSEVRRNSLVTMGVYPFVPAKGLGWKSYAGFLSFDPATSTSTLATRKLFDELVEEVDVGFIKTQFKPDAEASRVFAADGLQFQTIERALKDGARYRLALEQERNRQQTKGSATSSK